MANVDNDWCSGGKKLSKLFRKDSVLISSLHTPYQVDATCTEPADASAAPLTALPTSRTAPAPNIHAAESATTGEHSRHCWLRLYALLATTRLLLFDKRILHRRGMLEYSQGIFHVVRYVRLFRICGSLLKIPILPPRIYTFGGLADNSLDPELQFAPAVGVPALRQTQLSAEISAIASEVYGGPGTSAIEHQRSRPGSVQPEVHQATTADLQTAGIITLSLLNLLLISNYVIEFRVDSVST